MRIGNSGNNNNGTPPSSRLMGFLRAARGNRSAVQASVPGRAINPALEELRRLRDNNHLNSSQAEVVQNIEQFYVNARSARTNGDIARLPTHIRQNPPQDVQAGLARRPSFLLNSETLKALPSAIVELAASDTLPRQAKASLVVNAIVTSVKHHIEHVEAAALEDAQRGKRICPMTLQPAKLRAFLSQQEPVLEEIISACQLPSNLRESEVERHLTTLATNYFNNSENYPGAPTLRPASVQILMHGRGASTLGQDRRGLVVNLLLDSTTMAEFCRNPLWTLNECGTFQDIHRARQLQGFERHTFQKKLAALLIQQTLQEVSEIQETLGVQSAAIPSHSGLAQQAGKRTKEELYYAGSRTLSDHTVRSSEGLSQRAMLVEPMQGLPTFERHFNATYNEPLFADAEVRKWINSPEILLQLRGLTEPSARILAQISPATGRALLQTHAFSII